MKTANAARRLLDYLAGRYRPSRFPYVGPLTLFHEYRTAEFHPLIELDASNGLSLAYRDTVAVTGDGSVTEGADGDLVVSSGTQSGADARLETKERGRYQPGIVGLPGWAMQIPVMPTGDAEVWGEYGDGVDWLRLGADSDGVYLEHGVGGVVQSRVRQEDWSGDTLTGDRNGKGSGRNPSGEALDLTNFVTIRTPFIHYGAGPGDVELIFPGASGHSVYVTAHTFGAPLGRPFFTNPKLKIRQYASAGTTGVEHKVHVGGREFGVLGRYRPNRKQTTAESDGKVAINDTSVTPMASFRKKSDRKWLSRSVKVSGVGIPSDADGYFEIIIGGTLTAGGVEITDSDWGDISRIDPSETAVEVSTAADAITGGTRIDGGPLLGGGGNRFSLAGIRALGIDIPDDVTVTLAAKTVTGTGEVFGTFSLEEEA